jgi:hypothetical protein
MAGAISKIANAKALPFFSGEFVPWMDWESEMWYSRLDVLSTRVSRVALDRGSHCEQRSGAWGECMLVTKG